MLVRIPKLGFEIEVEDSYSISQEEAYWLIDNFRVYEIEYIKGEGVEAHILIDDRYLPVHDYALVNGKKVWL